MLNRIPKRTNRTYKRKRIGRGYGSKVGGHTVGRGTKGQLSRTGHKSMQFFEGGQLPFYKKVPKYRGFKKSDKLNVQAVNVSVLDVEYKDGDVVSFKSLADKGLIKKNVDDIKILGNGELSKKITVEGLSVSESAKKKILDKKGSIK